MRFQWTRMECIFQCGWFHQLHTCVCVCVYASPKITVSNFKNQLIPFYCRRNRTKSTWIFLRMEISVFWLFGFERSFSVRPPIRPLFLKRSKEWNGLVKGSHLMAMWGQIMIISRICSDHRFDSINCSCENRVNCVDFNAGGLLRFHRERSLFQRKGYI